MQTELVKLEIKSNIVDQGTDTAYNLNFGKKELVPHKDLFLAALEQTRLAHPPLRHKLLDLETMLTTWLIHMVILQKQLTFHSMATWMD